MPHVPGCEYCGGIINKGDKVFEITHGTFKVRTGFLFSGDSHINKHRENETAIVHEDCLKSRFEDNADKRGQILRNLVNFVCGEEQ